MKNKKRIIIAAMGAALTLTACNTGSMVPVAGAAAQANRTMSIAGPSIQMNGVSTDSFSAETSDTENAAVSEQKLIRTVRITLEVPSDKELLGTLQKISELAKKQNGAVSGQESVFGDYDTYGTMEIKIPKANVDAFLSDLKSQTNVKESYDNTEDITSQYVDTETRLKVKEEARDKYMEYLKDAKSVDEVLAIQERLDSVIADIEASKSIMETYDKQIEYTDVSITAKCRVVTAKEPYSEKFAKSLSDVAENAGNVLIETIKGVSAAIIISAFAIPTGAFFARLFFFLLRVGKKRVKASGKQMQTLEKAKDADPEIDERTRHEIYERDL